MNWRVPLADLDYGSEEIVAVEEVLHSRWLTMGAVTQQFEREFARLVGARHALAVGNATQALHLACLALGVGDNPGDEVIVPSLTFVATANVVLYCRANVRFADVLGPHELNISPDEIEKNITPHTQAIIVVHYGGYPCRMAEITRIAADHGLAVIEDAAHAPGASLHECALGNWGDIGCFSFFSNKNMATGEGGMLVTNRDDVAEKVRVLRSHGMTSVTWDRHLGHAYTYDVVALGYNYRIDEIRSGLGLAQLRKLEGNNQRRRIITEQYRAGLAEALAEGVILPFVNSPGQPAYHIFPILLPEGVDRLAFIERMRAAAVQTSIHYPPIHLFSYYRRLYPDLFLPVTEAVAARQVTLPLYPTMKDQDVEYVIKAAYDALAVVSGIKKGQPVL